MWWGGRGARRTRRSAAMRREAAGVDALVRAHRPADGLARGQRAPRCRRRAAGALPRRGRATRCRATRTCRSARCSSRRSAARRSPRTCSRSAPRARAARGVAPRAERSCRWTSSSFGPTDDGRIKPELLAGGDAVRSASGRVGRRVRGRSAGTLQCDRGDCGRRSRCWSSCTASTHGGADPRAAELKALLVDTAREAGAERGPDYGAGYGLLDVQRRGELIAAGRRRRAGRAPAARDGRAGRRSRSRSRRRGRSRATPLRVMLAWIDPPGAGAGGAGRAGNRARQRPRSAGQAEAGEDERAFNRGRSTPRSAGARLARRGNHADNVEVVDVPADDAGGRMLRSRASGRGRAVARRPQELALVSSVPLVPAGSALPPVAALPRYVVLESPRDEPPAPARVAIANRGGGALGFRASARRPVARGEPRRGPSAGRAHARARFRPARSGRGERGVRPACASRATIRRARASSA